LQARGHYLPLVVPFVPTMHGHLLESCALPDAPANGRQADDVRREAELACLAEGFVVTLDGEALPQAPELYSDARRDLRGLLYMVPLAGQERGRHELVVALTPAKTPSKDQAPPIWRIPYWY
jgi:hypothetical protein